MQDSGGKLSMSSSPRIGGTRRGSLNRSTDTLFPHVATVSRTLEPRNLIPYSLHFR